MSNPDASECVEDPNYTPVETEAPAECSDIDAGATDAYGDTCAGYSDFPDFCHTGDDSDFVSGDMCCACGGGSTR
jgi:hypothetical protein